MLYKEETLCTRNIFSKRVTFALINLILTTIALIWILISKLRGIRLSSLIQIPKSTPLENDPDLYLLQIYRSEVDYYLVLTAAFTFLYCMTDFGLACVLMYTIFKKYDLTRWISVSQGVLVVLIIVDFIIFMTMKGKMSYSQIVSVTFLGLYILWKFILFFMCYAKSNVTSGRNRRLCHSTRTTPSSDSHYESSASLRIRNETSIPLPQPSLIATPHGMSDLTQMEAETLERSAVGIQESETGPRVRFQVPIPINLKMEETREESTINENMQGSTDQPEMEPQEKSPQLVSMTERLTKLEEHIQNVEQKVGFTTEEMKQFDQVQTSQLSTDQPVAQSEQENAQNSKVKNLGSDKKVEQEKDSNSQIISIETQENQLNSPKAKNLKTKKQIENTEQGSNTQEISIWARAQINEPFISPLRNKQEMQQEGEILHQKLRENRLCLRETC